MCTKHIKHYIQCSHTGVQYGRCQTYVAKPQNLTDSHNIEKCPETINGLCRKCGGGPQKEPVITYLDSETVSSWSKETTVSPGTPSSLDSGLQLVRKGSQRAVGGVKRFIGSIRSNRRSGGNSSLLDGVSVSETESPFAGENAAYSGVSEPLAESKTVDTSRSIAKHWQRAIEGSSDPTHSSLTTTGNMHGIRPSLGRDMETASVVTTWTKVVAKAGAIRDSGSVEATQADRDLYQQRVEASQSERILCQQDFEIPEAPQPNAFMDQRRLEELARADGRLAGVRDGRGSVDFNVI
jgi:hypothetical protein